MRTEVLVQYRNQEATDIETQQHLRIQTLSHTFPVIPSSSYHHHHDQQPQVALAQGPPTTRPDLPTTTSAPPITKDDAKGKNIFQHAFDETVFFAGGLIPHPVESTRHYSILRHSPALVWYRGPSTSVAITIFSDRPLPPDRSFWLQRKGFSGSTGMALKSMLGATTSWLDVTPSTRASPADLPPNDERGYQRDISRFLKKHKDNNGRQIARETHVIRIPVAAEDGYFRLVLCTGGGGDGTGGDPQPPDNSSTSTSTSSTATRQKTARKKSVLCPSPVFRVASTSSDASVFRGAGLRAMPLEIGVKVGSTVAANVVNRYVAPARLAATAAAAGVAKKVEQKAMKRSKQVVASRAVEVGVAKAGWKTGLGALEERYAGGGGGTGYAPLGGAAAWDDMSSSSPQALPPEVVGSDDGPVRPFPVKLSGTVGRGTGRGGMALGIPTANLQSVTPEDVPLRMRGVYLAWACVVPRQGLPESMSHAWHEAIVTAGPSPYATPAVVAARNEVTVHFLHEFGGVMFYDAKVKVLVMGQLRRSAPYSSGHTEGAIAAYADDVVVTVASLSRPNWGPMETCERLKTLKSERSFTDRYVDARDKVQKQVDRIPLHWAGVRTEGAAMRDQALGTGGFWVQR
ncbi:hypothetical protein SODALDRAFT_278999 [Sodiomyces alkalinus F11]|uniref:Riboflavin kinase n=1 Tax=Sodiomyces alkalinus (strain CBS 110278 / VKM F-3762 / F11) TaxID=1314773 RepID=A0A3N2PUH3_SODAK|nr:hypothetical protein SODALDRAFT_278999 [Sodiomyces alkalinus F11]ROT38168.1 hypothetical protein SODALDRAFT_278999 [Sodiomyces alkalinus F11]